MPGRPAANREIRPRHYRVWPGLAPPTPAGKVERLIAVRLARQRRVSGPNRPDALQLSVILDQSVLLREIGDATVMRRQLDSLTGASEQPNITIRVLPLLGPHPVGTGPFNVPVFPPLLGVGPSTDVLYFEQLTRNEVFVDEAEEVFEYRRAFDQLAAAALDPDASRRLIAEASAMWSKRQSPDNSGG